MNLDLTGGIDSSRELIFAERPDNPEMRDSVSLWVFDDRGEVGLPRVGIEAVAEHWEEHGLQVNVAFADGRVFRLRYRREGVAIDRRRRTADRSRRGTTRLSLCRAVSHLDHDLPG